jgi:hypothetical protein
MNKPLVIAYHLMWTAYGHWLPNDPRGSTSKTVTIPLLAELGELYYGRREIQPAIAVLREFKSKASQVLKYPMLKFAPSEFDAVGHGISQAIEKIDIPVMLAPSCRIMHIF